MSILPSLLIISLAIVTRGFAAGDPQYYSITIDDRLAGYAQFEPDRRVPYQGRQAILKRSEAFIRLTLLGGLTDIRKEELKYLDPASKKLLGQVLEYDRGYETGRLDCEYRRAYVRMVASKNGEPGREDRVFIKRDTLIAHDHSFVVQHFARHDDKVAVLRLFDPERGEAVLADIHQLGTRKVGTPDEPRVLNGYRVGGLGKHQELWVDAQSGQLVKLVTVGALPGLPRAQMVMALADGDVVNAVRKAAVEPGPMFDGALALPWPPGQTRTFRFVLGETPIGELSFTFSAGPDTEQRAYGCKSSLNLTIGDESRSSQTQTAYSPRMCPVSYQVDGQLSGKRQVKFAIRSHVISGIVLQEVTKGSAKEKSELVMTPHFFLLDNNMMQHFAVLCSRLPRTVGAKGSVPTYHARLKAPLLLSYKVEKTVESGGETLFVCRLTSDVFQARVWVTNHGQLKRFEQGRLVAELVGP